MAYKLKYRVHTASAVSLPVQVQVDGEAATAYITRTVVEAMPDGAGDKTLTLVMPADVDPSSINEGDILTLDVSIDPAPAAEPVEAEA